MKSGKQTLSFLLDGILSGVMIGIGGMVSLSCENRYIGAFLFSLGLFSILHLRYGLYTGKVGYLITRDLPYLWETLVTLVGNALGTLAAAMLLRLTRQYTPALGEKAASLITGKLSDGIVSTLILAFFCGILMFSAVELHRRCTACGNTSGALFGVVMPVVVFILCGFNHSVADMFYYFLAGCPLAGDALLYFSVVILGNALGGMLIPFVKQFTCQG